MAWVRHVWVDLERFFSVSLLMSFSFLLRFNVSSFLSSIRRDRWAFSGGMTQQVRNQKGTYPAVGPVGAAPLLRCLVDLDVLNDQVPRVQALGVGVGFGVLEQVEKEAGGFDGPAGLRDAELFS